MYVVVPKGDANVEFRLVRGWHDISVFGFAYAWVRSVIYVRKKTLIS